MNNSQTIQVSRLLQQQQYESIQQLQSKHEKRQKKCQNTQNATSLTQGQLHRHQQKQEKQQQKQQQQQQQQQQLEQQDQLSDQQYSLQQKQQQQQQENGASPQRPPKFRSKKPDILNLDYQSFMQSQNTKKLLGILHPINQEQKEKQSSKNESKLHKSFTCNIETQQAQLQKTTQESLDESKRVQTIPEFEDYPKGRYNEADQSDSQPKTQQWEEQSLKQQQVQITQKLYKSKKPLLNQNYLQKVQKGIYQNVQQYVLNQQKKSPKAEYLKNKKKLDQVLSMSEMDIFQKILTSKQEMFNKIPASQKQTGIYEINTKQDSLPIEVKKKYRILKNRIAPCDWRIKRANLHQEQLDASLTKGNTSDMNPIIHSSPQKEINPLISTIKKLDKLNAPVLNYFELCSPQNQGNFAYPLNCMEKISRGQLFSLQRSISLNKSSNKQSFGQQMYRRQQYLRGTVKKDMQRWQDASQYSILYSSINDEDTPEKVGKYNETGYTEICKKIRKLQETKTKNLDLQSQLQQGKVEQVMEGIQNIQSMLVQTDDIHLSCSKNQSGQDQRSSPKKRQNVCYSSKTKIVFNTNNQ